MVMQFSASFNFSIFQFCEVVEVIMKMTVSVEQDPFREVWAKKSVKCDT